jgi:transposase-like protein
VPPVDRAKTDGIKLTGQGGLLQQLTKRILESALEGEITDYLGQHEKAADGNTRNGTRAKTVVTEVGRSRSRSPRDRAGSFAPQIVRSGSAACPVSTRWCSRCPPAA